MCRWTSGSRRVALAVFILFFLVLNIFSGKRLAAVLGVGKKRRKQHGIAAGAPVGGEEAAAKPRAEERNGSPSEEKEE